jgi:hypothetical protein
MTWRHVAGGVFVLWFVPALVAGAVTVSVLSAVYELASGAAFEATAAL